MSQEKKEEEKKEENDLNNIIQYPQQINPRPSSLPKPINSSIPKISTPNECLLSFNESDWDMFKQIYNNYGNKLSCFYTDDLTRFVQGYSHEKERRKETFKRIDELLKRGFTFDKNPNEYNFYDILSQPMDNNDENESLKAWPVFIYGYDNEGHPIMYDEIGSSNPNDLDECFENKMRKLKTFRFRVLRRLHNTKRIQTMRYKYNGAVNDKGGLNAITKHCIVMDIKNFYAKSLTSKYRNLIRDIIGDESNLWPNTLEKMYIINAPWPFRFAWKIISNFIHPITVAKIDILGSDYINTMKKKIAINQIPKSYGGTCELPIKYGYTADIDNDILDGNYSTMNDPINLDIVPCIKNREKLKQINIEKEMKEKACVNDDDKKDKEQNINVNDENINKSKDNDKNNEDKNVKIEGGNGNSGSDDSYVKVKNENENESDKVKKDDNDTQ